MEVPIPFVVTERLRPRSSPGLAEYLHARERTDLPVKVTLPSPTLVTAFWHREASADAYPDPFDLIADARIRAEYTERGLQPERFMAEGAEYLQAVTRVDLPAGTTLGLHVCKGNGTQSLIAEGGYEDIARDVFRRAAGFDVFHLEFDDERSGSFEPLRHLPNDKVAVLGLVSTKWTALEDPEVLRRRIDEAAAFHPLERLVADTARAVWGWMAASTTHGRACTAS